MKILLDTYALSKIFIQLNIKNIFEYNKKYMDIFFIIFEYNKKYIQI